MMALKENPIYKIWVWVDCEKDHSILKTFRLLLDKYTTTYFNYRPRNMHNCFLIVEKKAFLLAEFNFRIGFYETKNLSDCGMY